MLKLIIYCPPCKKSLQRMIMIMQLTMVDRSLYNLNLHGVIGYLILKICYAQQVCIAAVCLGNEGYVHLVKLSWLIQKGGSFQVNIQLAMLSGIWLVWEFHINFMYDSVHQNTCYHCPFYTKTYIKCICVCITAVVVPPTPAEK